MVRFILVVSNMPPLLAGLLALIYFKKFDERLFSFKLFLLFNSIIQIAQLILSILKRNNLFLFHIDVPVEFALLLHFYYSFLKPYLDKKIFFTLTFLFITLSVVNSIFIQHIGSPNSYALIAEAIVLIILAIFAFIVLLDPRSGMNKTPIGKTVGLINIGIFVNFSTTLLISYFSNYLIHQSDKNIANYIWVYYDLAAVLMYSCFIAAIRKDVKQK
ncbi:hypothetical protein LX99_04207 [Mucilaginibacter oryzae]|uniref:YhhN-like protein n=2 Tax=Mucilaginibacter oryzae TaxID=468058 RepID=A0A316H2X3_9SPHI|nr:hypothetical protein LX99_04207 [Mucilaginibacter oryzae]